MPKLAQLQYEPPENLQRFVGPGVAREAKLLAARGMLPLPPRDLAYVLFSLTRETDPELKDPAAKSLLKMPENILKQLLEDVKSHPLLLDFFSRNVPIDSPLQEIIALNRSTHDETIAFQALMPNKRLVDIISENQLRILRNPDIVDALSENPLTGQAQLDRILKFVALETRRAQKQAAVADTMEVEIEEVEEPKEEKAETGESPEAEVEEVGAVTDEDEEVGAVTLGEESPWAKMTFDADLLHDHQTMTDEELEEIESNLYKKIQNMKVSQKIKLAIAGGANARALLIKDSNKMVSCAVLKSPRITENEIEAFTKSRSLAEDVIRIIANSKEWTKSYQVKLNLVQNPKCPQADCMRFLNFLRDKDLKDIAKSKNVSSNVATQAKRMIQRKEEKSKPGQKKGH